MTTTVSLNESDEGIVSSGGIATLSVQPQGHGITWHVDSVQVRASSSLNEGTCTIYLGTKAITANYRDETFTGSSGDTSDKLQGIEIRQGAVIFAVFSGVDPGATAYLTVVGTAEVE